MATHQPKDGHHPKESVLKTWNLAVRHNSQNDHKVTTAMNGHLPSPGWSHSILRMVTQHKEYDHQPSRRWSPIFQGMVTNHNHSQDGPPPSKSRSPTNMRNAAHQHRDGHPLCQGYGRTPSPWWSPTNSIKLTTIHRFIIPFPSTVTHHLKDGQLD